MKRLSSLFAFALLLFALGALAYTALNGTSTSLAQGEPPVVAGQAGLAEVAALEPAAPLATNKWNALAIPLDVGTMTADNVATYIQSFCNPACPGAVKKVSRWDAVAQTWVTRPVGGFFPPTFNVFPGMALLIEVDSTLNSSSFAWVDDVPVQCPADGCIRYGTGNLQALNTNGWNFIMIPLDKSAPMTADTLAADIGSVTKVSKWDASAQTWVTRPVGGFFPPNYAVQSGYPYLVLTANTASSTWPNTWP